MSHIVRTNSITQSCFEFESQRKTTSLKRISIILDHQELTKNNNIMYHHRSTDKSSVFIYRLNFSKLKAINTVIKGICFQLMFAPRSNTDCMMHEVVLQCKSLTNKVVVCLENIV